MTNKYYPTIGLEIHAELKTNTKMFCGCKNDPDEEKPNVNICPVCMAHPGALPVPNKKAIENVIKVGLAIDGKIADFSEFDRKNYFYPDIPKGYQISQYKFPIVQGGHLAGMDVTRVHLEEDTANNKHPSRETSRASDRGGLPESFVDEAGYSLIDFNRAGVPLMELVTEAHTFESIEETAKVATKFAKELQLILWYLGVSEANLEKGEMRVEPNISISKDSKILYTKVEVKNLNSFRSVERAIKYELERMTKLWEEGKESEIVQETRGWDESKQKTFSQRKKEGSSDYRYFPDPDLPKMKLHEAFDLEKMKRELPELPAQKRARYKKDFGIKDEDIEAYINDPKLGDYFKEVAEILQNKEQILLASNFISNDLVGSAKMVSEFIEPKLLAETVVMVSSGELSSRAAKDIILVAKGFEKGKTIREHAKEKNMLQSNDEGALKAIVEKIIKENPEVVAVYKGGKENAIMSLVGKIIKESNGSANPQIVIKLLKEML
jgi:aspartyl-tRNA(Asn)/glutamyl-tRNA(Gln) amidotransferase subunit B